MKRQDLSGIPFEDNLKGDVLLAAIVGAPLLKRFRCLRAATKWLCPLETHHPLKRVDGNFNRFNYCLYCL